MCVRRINDAKHIKRVKHIKGIMHYMTLILLCVSLMLLAVGCGKKESADTQTEVNGTTVETAADETNSAEIESASDEIAPELERDPDESISEDDDFIFDEDFSLEETMTAPETNEIDIGDDAGGSL